MSIQPQQFRDGSSQRSRSLRSQSPDYICVDERTLADWIVFAQTFAKQLKYFNESNQPVGDWSNFFAGDAQAIASAIETIDSNNSNLSADVLNRISQPHFALFLTFLKLLQYPQQQFKELTQRRLDFYYQQVLQLTQKTATPDRVHVVFSLVSNQTEYLIQQGTLLSAGADTRSQPLYYAVDTDIYITQAQVASVKALSVEKVYIDLKDIHQKVNRQGEYRTNAAFEEMLRWAIGSPNQGDNFPQRGSETMDIDKLNAMFGQIQQAWKARKDKGEKVSLEQVIDQPNQQYILNQLCFLKLDDFYFCFNVYNREINKGQNNIIPPTEREWQQVYNLVEDAYHKKINPQYRPVGRTEKRAVHARNVAEAKPNQQLTLKRFYPFIVEPGVEKSSDNSRQIQALGIAIASGALHLQEGTRTITLTLKFQPGTVSSDLEAFFNSTKFPFAVQISSAKGWFFILDKDIKKLPDKDSSSQPSASVETKKSTSENLSFSITLDPSQPAITAPAQDGSIPFQTLHPVIKITLKDGIITPNGKTAYQLFQNLCLEAIQIKVDVKGLKDLQLRSDRTVINPKSPFEPFGIQPTTGASFYFAHPEIVSKKLDSLSLNLDWMGLPKSFAEHYRAYFMCGLSPEIKDDSFKAKLDFFINRTWQVIGEENKRSLFSTTTPQTTATTTSEIKTVLESSQTLQYNKDSFAKILDAAFTQILDKPTSTDLLEQDRYFRLELSGADFQHDLYPLVLNKVATATDNTIRSLTVYPPYNPKVKAIAIDYQASAEISLKPNADNTRAGQIFQLHPFGYVELLPIKQQPTTTTENQPTQRYFFLPQYDEEGSLYIGIRELHPPQTLTLLFQVVSASGNADLPNPKIQWSYLIEQGWKVFQPNQVLSDSTNGLLDSGILHFDIPETATNKNPLMPIGFHWLRASVTDNAAAIPDVLDIRTQAVKATFIDQDNDPDHLSQPLAAQSIQSLVERNPVIAKVEQPYSSFGGRRQETQPAFYTRVSERLRHKQRAITRWDYERLVLERFPQIYKVKCLTQAEQNLAPGAAQVTVVVIPNLTNTAPFLPLEPKVPQYLLREIEVYLQAHTSPFVKVVVKNPHYQHIKYRVDVKFNQGTEQGYYLKKLNEELVQFLSPWAYEEQSDISFGSSIHSSTVIHFLETRPYVDYIANLKLLEKVANSGKNQSETDAIYQVNETNLAQVKQADSILVSAPEHIIGLIGAIDEGIGYMIVGIDFIVV